MKMLALLEKYMVQNQSLFLLQKQENVKNVGGKSGDVEINFKIRFRSSV